MNRYDQRSRLLAVCLSTLAGYVDSIGFLSLGGFFVSFMSGNSTRLGVGIAGNSANALIAAALILTFVLGVMAGSFVGHVAGHRRQPAVLALVAFLLAAAAGRGMVGGTHSAIAAMTLAMGAENAIFERDGEVQIGLTYMTGTLVKFGQRLTGALLGGDRLAWAPYLLLWVGLVVGAVAGALIFPRFGFAALWLASAAAALFALVATRLSGGARYGQI